MATDKIGGATKIFTRVVSHPGAMTVDYHCAWDQGDKLWMIYLMRVIPAQLVLNKPGSVVLDMAVEQGGNCALSEAGRTVTRYGVQIIGQPNLPATVPADSSALYARNVLDFLKLLFDAEGKFVINRDDDIVAACLLCSGGEIVRKGA